MLFNRTKLTGLGLSALLLTAGVFAGAIIGGSAHQALAQYRFSQPLTRPHGSYYGYEYVTKSEVVSGNGNLAVYCPSGYQVTGGGGDISVIGSGSLPNMITQSHYAGAHQAWSITYWLYTSNTTVTAYAVCVKQ